MEEQAVVLAGDMAVQRERASLQSRYYYFM